MFFSKYFLFDIPLIYRDKVHWGRMFNYISGREREIKDEVSKSKGNSLAYGYMKNAHTYNTWKHHKSTPNNLRPTSISTSSPPSYSNILSARVKVY